MKLSFKIYSLLALLLVGSASLLAQDDPFPEVKFRLYQGNMTITAQVVQNGQVVTDAIVAVYCGETIRGKNTVGSGTNPQLVYLTVYGNTTIEEQQLYFKVYTGGIVFTYTPSPVIIFMNNSSIGIDADPYIITLPVPVSLADNGDNNSLLTTYNTQTCDVVLSSRKLYKDGDWNTLCLPFDVTIAGSVLDGDGVTAKTLNTSGTSLDTSTGLLTLSFETAPATILAGTPFIIKWNSSTDIVNPVFYGVTITSTTPTPVTSNDGNVTFVGQYSPFTIGDTSTGTFDGDIDEILLLTGGNMLGYSQNPRTLRSFRAHFYVPTTTAGARAVDSFVLDFGEGTGIAPLISPQGGTTHSPSGETEGAWYTLNGLRLDREPTAKGIYIHNGHKVVIK